MSVKGEAQRARYKKEALGRIGAYFHDKLMCYKYKCVDYVGTTGGCGPIYVWLCPLCEKETFIKKYRDITQKSVVQSCAACAEEAKRISKENSIARNRESKGKSW